MGLDYSYIVQVDKNKRDEILTYVDKHMNKESPSFKFENNELYLEKNIQVFYNKFENFFEKADEFPSRLTTSLIFEEDSAILNYLKEDYAKWHLEISEQEFLQSYRVEPNYFRIGGIDIYMGFYNKNRLDFADKNFIDARVLTDPNLMYFDFCAVTSDMSILFEESESIKRFFIELARDCGAEKCFLHRDDYEDMLIWQNERYK